MFYELFHPANPEDFFQHNELMPNQLGNHLHFYDGTPVDLDSYDIAIFGVLDDRGAPRNPGSVHAPFDVRQKLCELHLPNSDKPFRVLDMGFLHPGETPRDTYFALATVTLHLIQHHVLPVIIGGSHDLTYGQYLSYQQLQTLVNVVVIDERIDMLNKPEKQLDADSFVMSILTRSPNYLFHYAHLGHQVYLNDPKAVETLESLNFDCHRLGLVRAHMEESEPVLRDADMVSIDVGAIRMADAPAHAQASPNGFSGEELCQMCRYAGLSDKLTSIGIYEMNPGFDKQHQTAQLVAQMIWYFIEGFYQRRGDFPINLDEFLKFTVKMESIDHEIVFWKSKKTDRWWMELPISSDDPRYDRHRLVPCSFSDYELACEEELPDRWMKAYNKIV